MAMRLSKQEGALLLAGTALLLPGLTGCTQGNHSPVESGGSEPVLGQGGDDQTTSGKPPGQSDDPTAGPRRGDLNLDQLSDWDRELVLTLRDVGVADAAPGEHGYRGSTVVGHHQSQLLQVGTTTQDLPYDVDVLRTGRVRGVDIEVVKFHSSGRAIHFWCGPLHYDVRKMEAAGGGVDVDATEEFVDRLVKSLDC